jgi:hypothetical protein
MSATLSPQRVRVFLFGIHPDNRDWIFETFSSEESPVHLEHVTDLTKAEIVIVEDAQSMESIVHLGKKLPVVHLGWNSRPQKDSLIFRVEAKATARELVAQVAAAILILPRQLHLS